VTTPAVTIQDAIDFCADNIAELTFDGLVSIKTRMNAWIASIFGAAGAFTNVENNGQRRVIDWRGPTDMANESIEGPLAGDCGLIGSSNVIDAVVRTLCAVRDATIAGATTGAQEIATIAAFNVNWT
jgi:hypothetical protein